MMSKSHHSSGETRKYWKAELMKIDFCCTTLCGSWCGSYVIQRLLDINLHHFLDITLNCPWLAKYWRPSKRTEVYWDDLCKSLHADKWLLKKINFRFKSTQFYPLKALKNLNWLRQSALNQCQTPNRSVDL